MPRRAQFHRLLPFLAALALPALAIACSASAPVAPAPAAAKDAASDGTDAAAADEATNSRRPSTKDSNSDPTCHTDCFLGAMYCEGGMVLEIEGGVKYCNGKSPPPCGVVASYVCKAGCKPNVQARHGANGWLTKLPDLCADEPKEIGQACQVTADCQPAAQPATLPAGATPIELACDPTSLTCVNVHAPVIAGFGADCGLKAPWPSKSVHYKLAGWTTAGACQSGACFVAASQPYPDNDWPPVCLYQRCTVQCQTSADCPAGYVCRPLSKVDAETGDPVAAGSVCVGVANGEELKSKWCADWK